MSDKDVERNVRSTSVEGIKTPTQRHTHALGEKHAIPFGEKQSPPVGREKLLEKFRLKELRRKGGLAARTPEEKRGTEGKNA